MLASHFVGSRGPKMAPGHSLGITELNASVYAFSALISDM